MNFHVPRHLTDPMVRDSDLLAHGEVHTIDRLTVEIDRRKGDWLARHPGWTFTSTNLVRCGDGSPSPAYDIVLGFHRPRTPEELQTQAAEREAFKEKKERDFRERELQQKALLEEVLQSLGKSPSV
jgi:hypothetical protein